MRPGFGSPHPLLGPLLEDRRPLCVEIATWTIGQLELSTYAGEADLPDELVTSVRCVVTRGDQVLVCQEPDGRVMIFPGGRREPGETSQQTAVREVAEETGWDLDVGSLSVIGFLHFHHLSPVPADHPYPHPDFLQLVQHGTATGSPVDWVDPEGWVVRSWFADRALLDSQPLSPSERHLLALVLP